MIRPLAYLLAPLLILLGPSAPAPAKEDPPRPDRRVASEAWLGLSGGSLGVEADRDPGRLLAISGLRGALVATEAIHWGDVQPAMPKRGSRAVYDFEALDAVVLLWQLAGFQPVPVLTPKSSWASVPAAQTPWARRVEEVLGAEAVARNLRPGLGITPPRAANWRGFEAFVEAVVERYDGDGQRDMPGLRRPIRFVQILEEVGKPTAFLGDATDYLRLLHHAGVGARRANGQTQIVHGALDLMALGHAPIPQADILKQRLLRVVPREPLDARIAVQWEVAFWQRTLAMPQLYEVLALRGTTNHHDDLANIRWARHLLDAAADTTCRIWLTGVPPEHLADSRVPTAPRMKRDARQQLERWRSAAKRPRHSEHAIRKRWLERGHAFDLVRSVLLARLAGADAVLLEADPKRIREASALGESSSGTFERLVGPVADGTVQPTPAGRALLQLAQRLRGQGSIERISIGPRAYALVVQLTGQNEGAWCAVVLQAPHRNWAGDGRGGGAREIVSLPVPQGRYRVETCHTDGAEASVRDVEAVGGLLSIELGPEPLYVYPSP